MKPFGRTVAEACPSPRAVLLAGLHPLPKSISNNSERRHLLHDMVFDSILPRDPTFCRRIFPIGEAVEDDQSDTRPSDVMISFVENADEDWTFGNGCAQFVLGDL